MSTEPKRGTCDRESGNEFFGARHIGQHHKLPNCLNWREVESAPAQPGAGYRISDEYGCNCGVGNCDPVAHAADCPLKTRPPSVNPYRSVPPAAETAPKCEHCNDTGWLPETELLVAEPCDCRAETAEAAKLKLAELEKALRFVGMMLDVQCQEAGDIDGATIEEWLINCGFYAPTVVTKPCDESEESSCMCAEVGFPTTCNKLTEIAKAALASLRAESKEPVD